MTEQRKEPAQRDEPPARDDEARERAKQQGIKRDDRGQEQPADQERAQRNK